MPENLNAFGTTIPELPNSVPVTDGTLFVARDPTPQTGSPMGVDRRYSGQQLLDFILDKLPPLSASEIENDSDVPGATVAEALANLTTPLASAVMNNSDTPGNTVADALDGLEERKLDAADFNDRWKGLFVSLAELIAAWPEAEAGDYATVDPGAGSPPRMYVWDADTSEWAAGSDTAPGSTDQLPEGSANQYFTAQRVRNTTQWPAVVLNSVPVLTNSLDTRMGQLLARGALAHAPISPDATQNAIQHSRMYFPVSVVSAATVVLAAVGGEPWPLGCNAFVCNPGSGSSVTLQPAATNTHRVNGIPFTGTEDYVLAPGEILDVALLRSGGGQFDWSVRSNMPQSRFNRRPNVIVTDATTLALGPEHIGMTVWFTANDPVTVTVPVPVSGLDCALIQGGDGPVTVDHETGVAVFAESGLYTTAAQFAPVSLLYVPGVGFWLGGQRA